MDSVKVMKQCLNVFVTVMCGFNKVPQIKQLYYKKSTEGLSFLNILIELFW